MLLFSVKNAEKVSNQQGSWCLPRQDLAMRQTGRVTMTVCGFFSLTSSTGRSWPARSAVTLMVARAAAGRSRCSTTRGCPSVTCDSCKGTVLRDLFGDLSPHEIAWLNGVERAIPDD
jgi:hypothetical protein